MRITRRLIGIAAICFVSAAAADDGEVCVRGSGDTSIEAGPAPSSPADTTSAISQSSTAIAVTNGTAWASSRKPSRITTRRKIPTTEWLYGRGVAKLIKGDTSGGNSDIASAKTIKADIAEDYTKYGVK